MGRDQNSCRNRHSGRLPLAGGIRWPLSIGLSGNDKKTRSKHDPGARERVQHQRKKRIGPVNQVSKETLLPVSGQGPQGQYAKSTFFQEELYRSGIVVKEVIAGFQKIPPRPAQELAQAVGGAPDAAFRQRQFQHQDAVALEGSMKCRQYVLRIQEVIKRIDDGDDIERVRGQRGAEDTSLTGLD